MVWIRQVYVPLKRTYKSNYGLSEKLLKERLERSGWTVWRGGNIHILCFELFPNVRRKYEKLIELLRSHDYDATEQLKLLSHVHRGMPDFICYRAGSFKFVECKLGNESLSKRQVACIARLQNLGFPVEVHRMVFSATKLRSAKVNIVTKEKVVTEVQLALTKRVCAGASRQSRKRARGSKRVLPGSRVRSRVAL